MKFLLLFISLWALAPANVRANSPANPSQKELRKAIQTMLGASLPNSAVRVQRINTSGEGVVEASAEIEAVFRAKATDGHWRLSEVRTGQDTWERLDLIAQALQTNLPSGNCDAPSLFVRDPAASAMTVKRARCLVAELLGVTLPSEQVRIKDLSSLDLPFGSESSALIESSIQIDFRFARDTNGWRVAEFKSGNRDWTNLATFAIAFNEAKRASATNDLAAIANALIDFRRKRGAFVISDKESVLIDHLSPQYLTRVIRVDPWHRPYQYEGETDRFSLRSLGPDGKPNTPDDIILSAPTP
ncbi:MAG TPA: type II secretion system protein GspG [Pyrinomonadaceae bacterium]|nr:type II secretion system protein GspG [Pyrinomonadaceae bacterium]